MALSHQGPKSAIAKPCLPVCMPSIIDVQAFSQPKLALSAPDLLTACQIYDLAAVRQPAQRSFGTLYLQMAGNVLSGQVVNIHDVQDSFWYSLCIVSTSIMGSSPQISLSCKRAAEYWGVLVVMVDKSNT